MYLQITTRTREQVKATLFQYQKLRRALNVTQEICSLASEVGMSGFTKCLSLLTVIQDAWAEGNSITVRKLQLQQQVKKL